MNQEDYNSAMVGVEFANTLVSAADSKAARKHATQEAEKAREWQEMMYDRQLDDNIAWRTHQEVYNSPEAQMKRYRDAGINPMYAITGNGGNTVTTPNPSSVAMVAKADTPAPRNLRFNPEVLAQARLTKAQAKSIEASTRASDAQANMYNAQANEANARAEGYKSENVEKAYKADIVNELKKVYTDLGGHFGELVPFSKAQAWIYANKKEYDHLFVGMDFQNAKKTFLHLDAVRAFERDLHSHQRKMFEHELSQAKSAAHIFSVSAKWAIANQWINAGSQVFGAAASLFGSFKGTSFMPSVSRSLTPSKREHHYYGDTYNTINN